MHANMAMKNVIIIFAIVAFIGLVGCSNMKGDMLADDTEAAANFAGAPAVVQVEHGTILGPPLVVPEDTPTVDIEAVFSEEPWEKLSRGDGSIIGWYLEGGPKMLRFRITVSEAPKDDMVVLVSGTCKFGIDLDRSFLDTVRTFSVYMIIPKGQTASNIYRTSFNYPKEINIDPTDGVDFLSFEVMPLRAPLPALPLKGFLDDFMPPVEIPENYEFQLYKAAENARIITSSYERSGFLRPDSKFIIAPDLLTSHLDP